MTGIDRYSEHEPRNREGPMRMIAAAFAGFLAATALFFVFDVDVRSATRPLRAATIEDASTAAAERVVERRVTGIGGVFFKSADPPALLAWYERHLGLTRPASAGHVNFCWLEADGSMARTIWGPFPDDTRYFDPGRRDIMMNFRVHDLAGLLTTLRDEGVTVVDTMQSYEYGRFGWILDLEGNKIELWESAAEVRADWEAACE